MADQQTDAQKLSHEATEAREILMTAETVFPFALFTDTITIDRVKVTITKRVFFGSAEVISIQIEDILNVEADVGPFLGAIKMWTRFFCGNTAQDRSSES